MKTPYDKLANMCTKYFGHMIKMTATPVYGKNPLKSSSLEPEGLVCSIGDVGPTIFAQIIFLR